MLPQNNAALGMYEQCCQAAFVIHQNKASDIQTIADAEVVFW